MKTLFYVVLAASLATNAWLLARPYGWATPPNHGDETSSGPRAAAGAPQEEPALTGIPASLFATANPVELRDALRSAGADEALVRAVLEGRLRRRYEEELAARRIDAARSGWWRGGAGDAGGSDPRLLQEMVLGPLGLLLGRDPRDQVDAENRYPFLAPAQRRRLAQIDLDFAEMRAASGTVSIERLKSEIDQEVLLAQERTRDVLATLTPEEQAEYELRFAGSAMTVSRRLATYAGSEQEYRVLKPQIDELERAARQLPPDAGFAGAYRDLQQRTMDRLVATLGYESALNYIWGGPGLYPSIVHTMKGWNLPASRAAELLQLAAETGERAGAIHRDGALNAEQKRAGLLTLQEAVRPQLGAIIPPGLQAPLPESAITWFSMLGEGRYKGFHPTLLSSGLGEVAPVSVSSRAPAPAPWPLALPRRPG